MDTIVQGVLGLTTTFKYYYTCRTSGAKGPDNHWECCCACTNKWSLCDTCLMTTNQPNHCARILRYYCGCKLTHMSGLDSSLRSFLASITAWYSLSEWPSLATKQALGELQYAPINKKENKDQWIVDITETTKSEPNRKRTGWRKCHVCWL